MISDPALARERHPLAEVEVEDVREGMTGGMPEDFDQMTGLEGRPRGSRPTKCKICSVEKVQHYVDAAIEAGDSDSDIYTALRRLRLVNDRFPIGALWWHRQRTEICAAAVSSSRDLATVVRDMALEMVEDGELVPTLQHGIMAQALIDKRIERAADRELALTIAEMLTSGAPSRVKVLSGVARDVTDDDDDDEVIVSGEMMDGFR